MNPKHPGVVAVILILVILTIPLAPIPDYWISLLNNIGLFSLVAVGLVLLTGVGGMTSFGQAAFVGFGAYTTAVLSTTYGISPWLTLPIALVLTAAAALAIGSITVRLSGHYLPLGTMAWGLAFFYLFGNLEFLGAHDGINGIPPLRIGHHDLFDGRAFFPVVWLVVLAAMFLTTNLLHTRLGRAIRALRSGTIANEAFGIDTAQVKLIVFVYAAVLAGLSGWLYAHLQRSINPTAFGINIGIEYLLMAVVGGAGHVFGAVLGAGIVTILKDQLQDILPKLIGGQGSYETIVFGFMLVVILQSARNGLWPLIINAFPAGPEKLPVPSDDSLAQRAMPKSGAVPVLDVRGICKSFGGLVAVNDVTFLVGAKEIVGLIGPNGAGKSTTFNLVTGLLRATGGEVLFRGSRIDAMPARDIAALGIARTFQHVELAPEMSVLENVAIGAHIRGSAGLLAGMLRLDRAEEKCLLGEAARQLQRVGLGEYMHRPAGSLALGQLRILEIARALALDPALLLLDEPAAGLRHLEKRELAALLNKLRAEGMSILLVEHDVEFVMGLTDHLVVLDFGKLIAKGVPAEIRKNPIVLEAYLGGVV